MSIEGVVELTDSQKIQNRTDEMRDILQPEINNSVPIGVELTDSQKIQIRRDEIRRILQPEINKGLPFGVEFKTGGDLCYGLITPLLFKGDRLVLDNASQISIGTNVSLEKPKKSEFNIMLIEMGSFKTISKEEVEGRNKKVIDKLDLEEKQGKHIEDITALGFKVSPDTDGTLPITFQHEDVNHVVPISQTIEAASIIAEMLEQASSPKFEAKKNELEELKSRNEDILEGSKIKNSIEKVLEKDIRSDLKTRYETLKESIKQPVETLNKQYIQSLDNIAKAHNEGIKSQISKTTKDAIETRRKYKLAINKTKSTLKDRLSGKSKGILGSFKTSKLENLSKILGKDETEIESQLDKAKRYITIKGRLLEWSRKSTDKLELTEAQIESLVDTFTNKDYEESLDKFIENLNMNTMSIISLILTVLQSELQLSAKYAPQHKPILINVLKQFIESLQKINDPLRSFTIDDDSLEKLLAENIELYADFKNDSYITPMKLFDIKDSLFSIINLIQPLDKSDSESESTIKSTSSSSRFDRKRAKIAQINKERGIVSDTLTPIINRIKADVDEYIPNIKSGELLLTTERELKSLIGKKTGELKEKHYYLDKNGKVKKIGSDTEYKLVVNPDGLIPPYLPHLRSSKSQSSSLSETVNTPPTLVEQQAPAPAPAPAPAQRKGFIESLSSFRKGTMNRFRLRTSSKNRPSQEGLLSGGKHKTRKNHKNKTRRNKPYGRR